MDLYPLTLDYQLAKNLARWEQQRRPFYEAYRKDTQRILNHMLKSMEMEKPAEKCDFSDFSIDLFLRY